MSERVIPNQIKRQLRQEADFGCCKCGIPILEYHHIIPWHKVKKHNPRDMMVLCPNCHHSIDSYSIENQRKFKDNPFNLDNPKIAGSLIIPQGICVIDTGAIKFLGDGPVIVSKEISFLEFYVNESNILELSLILYNENNDLLLKIVKNEWIQGDIKVWDIEFSSKSKKLNLREKKGKINLSINANSFHVQIQGAFWVHGKLITLNKQGIKVNNSAAIKTNKKVNDKFEICHFKEDAWSFQIGKNNNDKVGPDEITKTIYTNDNFFEGVDYYSGCWLEFEENIIKLVPKPSPFEWRVGNSMNVTRAKDALTQSIKTIEYFNSNITFISDLQDKLFGGMNVVDKQISSIPFKIKLARFYKHTNNHIEALQVYSEIQLSYRKYYKKPNINEAEVLFEVSKYLMTLKNIARAKDAYINSYLCFFHSGSLPFRLLDFSKQLFNENEKCFCGSQKTYGQCHLLLTTLNNYSTKINIPIKITGLPKDSRVALYFLKTHKIHESVTKEEYMKGYEYVFSEKCNDIFDFKIKANKDMPMILYILHYGSLPIIKEFVLRQGGVSMNIETPHNTVYK